MSEAKRVEIYGMLKDFHNDDLIQPNESPNANKIYHLYSDGQITYQKGGWAYGHRSEFNVESGIDIKMNLDINKFKYLLTTNTNTFAYIIVSEENARLIKNEMLKLTEML